MNITLTRSEYDAIKCRCGLWYLAGTDRPDDPYLRASYDPIMGRLDECSVCESKESVI